MRSGCRGWLLALLFCSAATSARALDPGRPLGDQGLDAWTPRQGLPSSFVNRVVQTPDGYLWLATYDGVVRFDGVRFTTYRSSSTPGLANDGIRDLDVARDGALWVATNGGGVSRMSAGRFTRYGAAEGLADALVWAIHADPVGLVWAGASTGALYVTRDGATFVRERRPGTAAIGAILGEPDGTLWVGTYGGGLERRGADGTWTTFTAVEGLPSDTIGSLARGPDGTVWAGTAAGVARVRAGGIDAFALGPDGGVPVWSVHVDRHGTLWAGGARGTVGRFGDGRLEVVPRTIGLPDGVIPSLLEDHEGNLWLGSGGYGLLRLRDVAIVSRGRAAGLPSDLVLSLHDADDGGLLVGTSAGLSRLRGQRAEVVRSTAAPVRSVEVAPDGTIWVGTDGAGVGRLRAGTWTAFTTADGLGNDSVRAVVVDRDGVVWAATLGGLSRFDGRRWTNLDAEDGLPAPAVLSLIVAADGTVWGGTEGAGLFRIRGGRIDPIGSAALDGTIVLGLADAGAGAVWAGTSQGLAHASADAVLLLGDEHGVPGAVSQIVTDGGANVWTCGSEGLRRLPRAGLEAVLAGRSASVQPSVFGTADGLGSPQCTTPAHPAGLRDRAGQMHFATYGGVATVYPDRLQRDEVPPPVHVEEVRADGETVGAVAGPGVRRLEIRYTGICLRAPRRVTFRYRLEGFDPDWIDAGTERVAQYTNLPPGRYTFRVAARNASGVWNDTGAAAPVELRPLFWQTRLFLVLGLLALAGAIVAAHRWRVRRLHERERELGALVAARTRDLQAALERAERADAFKTRMVGIAAHDLKNPLTTVLASTQLLEHVGEEERRELLESIGRSTERTLRLVDDLLLVAALESGRLELVRRRIDLSALARAAGDDNLPQARRKRQAIVVAGEPGVDVDADEDRLRQVADNLVVNAIKFSSPGATITITVGARGDVARLEVSDEGPGIPREEVARLFDPFSRLSNQPTTGEPSTGLGLSIVRQIVELHGGHVGAQSRGDRNGTTFFVELPLLRTGPEGPSEGDGATLESSSTRSSY